MSERPLLSVVMPAWNEERYIRASLEALFSAIALLEERGGAAEVVVVDNDSDDATSEVASEFPVRIVTETRRQIAAVRNRGAREAKGSLLAFIDADSHASENSMLRIYHVLSGGDFAGGGVNIRPERWTLRVAPMMLVVPVMRILMGISAGLIFATREAFEAVGGFDETVFASEDVIIGRALKLYAAKHGKKYANLTDVHITTSIRKFDKLNITEMVKLSLDLIKPGSVWRRENCGFWYDRELR